MGLSTCLMIWMFEVQTLLWMLLMIRSSQWTQRRIPKKNTHVHSWQKKKIRETIEGFDATLMNYTSRFDFRKDNSRVWKSSYEKKGRVMFLQGWRVWFLINIWNPTMKLRFYFFVCFWWFSWDWASDRNVCFFHHYA